MPDDLTLRDVPLGTGTTGTRSETDSMGAVDVPAERYWGAQTQRSLHHFSIGDPGRDRMPIEVYRAYGLVKRVAAQANNEAGLLDDVRTQAIVASCREVENGSLDAEFPLYTWQTGSGTQSNMNVNEVVANRASQLLGGELGTKAPVHPNDHVNMSQSSNDTFPTAMHVAVVRLLHDTLYPSLDALVAIIEERSRRWAGVVKTGRTHLQDAVPVTVGQEWSGWAAMLADARRRCAAAASDLHELALGGTAVGTGLNAPPGFAERTAELIAADTGHPFRTAANKFAAHGSLDAVVATSAGLRGIAVSLIKVANDVRWLASGPRTGLHEIVLPENEPGSSIMPGKVNPTQEEAVVMVSIQVIGEDTAVAFAGSQGNFELNAMRPVIIANVLHSARILADVCGTWREHSLEGAELDLERIEANVGASLMLVTALSPHTGYEKAAAIAHRAHHDGTTLREASLAEGVDADLYDRVVDPSTMV